ncbi:MAG: hypothetical protein M3O62_18690 [Pseudomonadota bacterium]|nr:hypothetical protein [Pseudomonadota bacterium]
MTMLTRSAVFGLSLALAACGNDGSEGHSSVPDPATLCVSNSCGSKTVLLTIPDAENLIFTNSGRLFVSGGTNVFEISKDSAGAYLATAILDGTTNFTGLATIGNVLYANAFDGQLYATELTSQPQLRAIHDYGLAAPNGLVAGPDGELYATNGPLATNALPDPQIVRIDLDPDDPFKVTNQTTWFTAGLLGPNGIQRRGRTLYVSNTGLGGLAEIRTVEINTDGSAGASAQLLSFIGLPDDFSLVDDHLLVANFLTGEVMLYDGSGQRLQSTALLGFSFPSMVRTGQPPLFANTDILVTEKGILGDNVTPIGNVLSVFRATQ